MTDAAQPSRSRTQPAPPCVPDWPAGKRFAFTIIDDTDRSTLLNVRPLYDYLLDRGLLTTKTVWPLAPSPDIARAARPDGPLYGATLDDRDYRRWVCGLHRSGVEVAFHGATTHSSRREGVIEGLDRFREVIGADPRMYVTHVGQEEGMYWGAARLDGKLRRLYRLMHGIKGSSRSYRGHVAGDPYFWGDVCRDRITYVRNFVFRGINTLTSDPIMPYHDPMRPFVNYWFSSSDARDADAFCDLLSEANQDRLAEQGGACIIYSHLAFGFVRDGAVIPRVRMLLDRLSTLQGWFAPASTLLDHLRSRSQWHGIPDRRILRRMQRRWALSKLLHGTS